MCPSQEIPRKSSIPWNPCFCMWSSLFLKNNSASYKTKSQTNSASSTELLSRYYVTCTEWEKQTKSSSRKDQRLLNRPWRYLLLTITTLSRSYLRDSMDFCVLSWNTMVEKQHQSAKKEILVKWLGIFQIILLFEEKKMSKLQQNCCFSEISKYNFYL